MLEMKSRDAKAITLALETSQVESDGGSAGHVGEPIKTSTRSRKFQHGRSSALGQRVHPRRTKTRFTIA